MSNLRVIFWTVCVTVSLTECTHLSAQTWHSTELQATVYDLRSSRCALGNSDFLNEGGCSLTVKVLAQHRPGLTYSLPPETNSVETVWFIDPTHIVFKGIMRNGFVQLTAVDIRKGNYVLTLLAQQATLSPTGSQIAFEDYQPPHDGQSRRISITVMSLRGADAYSSASRKTIFQEMADTSDVSDDHVLCSSSFAWSSNEAAIAFCDYALSANKYAIMIASLRGVESFLMPINKKDVCRMKGDRDLDCKLVVSDIVFGEKSINLGILIRDDAGERLMFGSAPLFKGIPTSPLSFSESVR